MGAFDDVWRIHSSRTLAVNSGGGAVASTASLSAQTYAVDLVFAGLSAATAARVAISDIGAAAVSSLSGALVPANTIVRYKCSPGQMVQAISNDASVIASLTVIELTK